MFKYRLTFGLLIIAVSFGLFYIDDWLDRVNMTGTVWQQVFLGRTHIPSGLVLLATFVVLIALTARELCEIFRTKGYGCDPLLVGISGISGCTFFYVIPSDVESLSVMAIFGTLLIGLFVLALVRHGWRRRAEGAIAAAGVTLLAAVYLGLCPGFLIAIRRGHSAWVVAAIILITKCCDMGAYFTGCAIGRHRMVPWLSARKTWEGLAGGVALSTVVAVGLVALSNAVLHPWRTGAGPGPVAPLSLWYGVLGGAGLALIGQFGDLIASLLKRDAGLKDSGRAVPGLGGLLDMFDSLLVVGPPAYWVLNLTQRALSENP